MSARYDHLLDLIDDHSKANIGYDQISRWSWLDTAGKKIVPNREGDCSAVTIGLIWLAGYPIPSGNIAGSGSCYTGNAYSLLVGAGWKARKVVGLSTAQINAVTGPGDALLALAGHIMIKGRNGLWYSMAHDENNRATGGRAGDQTGKESSFTRLYAYRGIGWDWVFSAPDKAPDSTPPASTDSGTGTSDPTPAPAPTPVVEAPKPLLTTIDHDDSDLLTRNPVDELNVSNGFAAALTRTAHRVSRASLWYEGRPLDDYANLPLTADQSKISVSSDSPVRRRASLQFDAGQYRWRNLRSVLEEPGVTIRVETGFNLGGSVEMVPVFESSPAFSVASDDVTGTIKVDAPDRMEMVSRYGFGQVFCSNTDATFQQLIQAILAEVSPGAQLVDLTGSTEHLPELLWDVSATGRIDACTQLAAALGAEFFKSPASGVWVLRPMVAPGQGGARWEIRAGRELVSSARTVDKGLIFNHVTVECERSDAPAAQGTWYDTDPDSATRYGGPMGRRMYDPQRTSMWSTPADLSTYAAAIGTRLKGRLIDLDWSMLINPLMEAGDPIDVITPDFTYACVLDSFEIPLGSQRVTPGKARALKLPGVLS